MMQVLGYVPRDSRNNGIRNAMCMAMLLQRDAQLDHITVTTLQQIAATCRITSGKPQLLYRVYWLHQGLLRKGLITE